MVSTVDWHQLHLGIQSVRTQHCRALRSAMVVGSGPSAGRPVAWRWVTREGDLCGGRERVVHAVCVTWDSVYVFVQCTTKMAYQLVAPYHSSPSPFPLIAGSEYHHPNSRNHRPPV
jgi:hypothetical protein